LRLVDDLQEDNSIVAVAVGGTQLIETRPGSKFKPSLHFQVPLVAAVRRDDTVPSKV
jgi:hypothetical protein